MRRGHRAPLRAVALALVASSLIGMTACGEGDEEGGEEGGIIQEEDGEQGEG